MLKKLVKVLSTELIYRYIAGMQAQQVYRNGNKKLTKEKANKWLKQSIKIQLFIPILYGFIIGIAFLAPLIAISLGYNTDEVYGGDFTINWLSMFPVIAFIWTFIWIMQQSWLLQEHKLLEPLYSLPIPERELRLALIFLLLSFSTLGIIICFGGIAIIEGFKSIENFFICLGYGAVTILLSLAFGLFGGSILATRGHGTVIKRIFSTLLILIMCLSIALVSQIGVILPKILPKLSWLNFKYSEFVYPFSFSQGLNKGIFGLIPMLGYLAFSYFLYKYSFSRYLRRVKELVYKPPKRKMKVKINFHHPIIAHFIKDIKLISREPRIMYSFIIFPVMMIIISFSWSSIASTSSFSIKLAIWAMIMLFGLLCCWLLPSIALGIDAKYMPLLNTLPRAEISLIYSKSLISIIPFSIACLIIALISEANFQMLIAPIALGFAVSIVTISLTLEYLPKTSTFVKITGKQTALMFLCCLLLLSMALLPCMLYYEQPEIMFGVSSITSLLVLFAVILASSKKKSYEIKPFFAVSFVALCIVLWQGAILPLSLLKLKPELSFLFSLLIEFGVIFSLVYLLFRFKKLDWKKELGFKFDKIGVIIGPIAGLCYLPVGVKILAYMQKAFPVSKLIEEFSPELMEQFSNLNLSMIILSIIFLVVIAPICEELLFRGFLQNSLRKHIGPTYAILASSILFGLFHFSIFKLPHLIILGVILGMLFNYKKSIYSNILAHAAYNGAIMIFPFMVENISKLISAL